MIPRKYRGVSFDRAPVTNLDDTDVVRQVAPVRARPRGRTSPPGRGLWFIGDVGTGKTTLAMLVSKAAIDAGHSVAIYSVPHLLAEIRDTYDRDPGERSYMDFFNRLAAVDLLHLEDVGAEKQTDWVLEQLYSLINERYEQQRSILVTTNLRSRSSRSRSASARLRASSRCAGTRCCSSARTAASPGTRPAPPRADSEPALHFPPLCQD